MPISTPGRVLFKNIPLKFVASKVRGGGGRAVNTEVTLVPFIDLLISLVVFLLMSFSASGELLAQSESIRLPDASMTTDLDVAPVIAIDASVVTLDGRQVANVPALLDNANVERLDALVNELATLKRNWSVLHPRQPFDGNVVIQADRLTDYRVLKKVFHAMAEAGYPNISYAVNKIGD